MMRAGASLTENRFFNNCGGKLFAKTGPILLDSNTRRATEQDLKRMLGVYFEQNVTTEKFEDYDGDRWVIVGE